jgi:hypothetical protein
MIPSFSSSSFGMSAAQSVTIFMTLLCVEVVLIPMDWTVKGVYRTDLLGI